MVAVIDVLLTTVTLVAMVPPTLTVAPGKSISVFVAHDLDFSTAEAGR